MLVLPAARAQETERSRRKVTIQWREVDKAVRYDLQLARTPEMDPLLLRKDVEATSAALSLSPGTYFFRVRGIDSADAPGPWSEVEGFVVNPAPPRALLPRNKHVFSQALPEEGIRFRWSSGVKGTEYQLQIDDGKGVLIDRNVRASEYLWKAEKPGKYRWRVGFETPTGKEWSAYSWLAIHESAFPKPEPVAAPAAEENADGQDPASGELSDEERKLLEEYKKEKELAEKLRLLSLKPGYWLLLRYAQSVVAYNGRDVDLDRASTGAALVALGSAEFRWRAGRSPGSPWTLSASANFELINQTVLGTSFYQPRAYGRVFYTRSVGKWRMGPFLHVGIGQGLIFVVQSEVDAIRTKVSRTSVGLGGSAVLGASDTLYFSAIAMLRRDMGGSSTDLPSPVEANFGLEAGFGVFFSVAEKWSLEGRLRAMREAYSWQPAAGGDALSSMSNMFIILDAGVGYQF